MVRPEACREEELSIPRSVAQATNPALERGTYGYLDHLLNVNRGSHMGKRKMPYEMVALGASAWSGRSRTAEVNGNSTGCTAGHRL